MWQAMEIIEVKNKHVTVTLGYDELRDISNGLYHASMNGDADKEIYAKTKFLFDMSKHGMIMPETIDLFCDARNSGITETGNVEDDGLPAPPSPGDIYDGLDTERFTEDKG